jgi:uncharacterized protein (TIGR03083 family)
VNTPTQDPDLIALVDTLDDVWHSLAGLGAGLTEAQWKQPTALPGWTVQDNLSHIIGFERMLQGLPPTEHVAAPRAYIRNPIGESNEHEVDARRALPGAAVLAEWTELLALRLDTLRAGDDAYFSTPSWTPIGEGTIGSFLHLRIMDAWLHEQDIRVALASPGNVDGPAAQHSVDRLLLTIPLVVGKRAGTPEGGAVAIDIIGPVHRHLISEVRDGRAKVVAEPTVPPLAHISLGSDAFVALAAGRCVPAELPTGTVTVTGDQELGARVLAHLNMMI